MIPNRRSASAKSGNRFSDKIMRQNKELERDDGSSRSSQMVGGQPISCAVEIFAERIGKRMLAGLSRSEQRHRRVEFQVVRTAENPMRRPALDGVHKVG